jgi:hypothetical protein
MNRQTNAPVPARLKNTDTLARWMDSRFRIPGTDIRFGLDSVIGLIPGVGDLSTFAVSGYLIWLMAQNGASGNVLARMVINVLFDSLLGSIPLIGDLFDVAFKANNKNMRLMQKHYTEGRYRGGAWKAIIPVLIILGLVIAAIVYAGVKLFEWIYQQYSTW